MTEAIDKETNPRSIKSFVLRTGRITPAQQRAMDSLWPQVGLDIEQGELDLNSVFGRDAETTLEIGFGMGASLLEMATVNPEQNFIGIEVHRPGVGRLLLDIQRQELTNIRVFCHDAVEVLAQSIPANSLACVQLFFPDPWHKKRHHKRRIVQPDFVELVRTKLKPNGRFHMATDWQNYAEHMMQVMSEAQGYYNIAGKQQYSPQPKSRPDTKFQQRGQRLGHGVWDLIFAKNIE